MRNMPEKLFGIGIGDRFKVGFKPMGGLSGLVVEEVVVEGFEIGPPNQPEQIWTKTRTVNNGSKPNIFRIETLLGMPDDPFTEVEWLTPPTVSKTKSAETSRISLVE